MRAYADCMTESSRTTGRARRGIGLGKGGAKRHRKILVDVVAEDEEEEEEEEDDYDDDDENKGYALFDAANSPVQNTQPISSTFGRPRKQLASKACRKSAPSSKKIKLNDGSDEDEDFEVDQDFPEDQVTLLQRLIGKQSFDGSWDFDSLPWGSIHAEKDAANSVIDDTIASHSDLDRRIVSSIVSTALVIAFLEIKMAEEEETWELVVEKARLWFEGVLDDEKVLDEIMEDVNALFK